MSIINVENLNFSFGDKAILNNISFRLLKEDHAGLVGSNGAGKTTLFNILTGRLVPDSGTIQYSSSKKIGYLDQHSILTDGLSIRDTLRQVFSDLYKIEKKMLDIGDKLGHCSPEDMERLLKDLGVLQDKLYISDFYSIDSKIDQVAQGLGLFALDMNTSVEKLSGGQRTKVKLAKLLLENPDILLLDEPTNYLDKEHIEWLSEYLLHYPNSFMVISHDTDFLDKITNVIYHLEFTNIKRYPGSYNKYLKLKDEETKRYIEQYAKQQEEIKRMEDFIKKNIVRAATTKRAQSKMKQLNKIERLEKPKPSLKSNFSFIFSGDSGKHVFDSHDLNIGYSYPIMNNLNLHITKGEKIAVTGCNGIGKSTLLKTIMGVIPPLGGKIKLGESLTPIYFEQETKASNLTAIEEVWNAYPNKTQREIREALARCGLRQELIFQKMSSLSGGEQAKVRLCKLMMYPGNWLLLDEPTNHLDVNAKLALKEAIVNFNGTVVLVCHESDFYSDFVTKIWDLEQQIFRQ